jgi:hypothetical protein
VAWLQVTRVEFMMFVLDNLGLVSSHEMDRILEMFDSADETHDGILNLQVPFAHQHRPAVVPAGAW